MNLQMSLTRCPQVDLMHTCSDPHSDLSLSVKTRVLFWGFVSKGFVSKRDTVQKAEQETRGTPRSPTGSWA